MKIILCTFLLCITAVSVFGQSVPLDGIMGKSIDFPAAVKKDGFLMYRDVPIGEVTSGSFRAPRNENYRDRLQWDSSTGLFSLSGLKMEDSGEYKVQNTDQNIAVFQLKVYIPVSKPHLNVTHNEYRCTILCAAVRGTGATLTLYREGEKKPYVTSPVRSHPHLDMTETVESGTYTCEARNSVSRETSDPLTVGAHCTAVFGQSVELNGILGKSIEFPAAVKNGGFLMYVKVNIGDSSREPPGVGKEKYSGRVQWDSSTGLFSLSGLKMEDSGEYKVHKDQNIITVFLLKVHKDNVPVSKPHVSVTGDEYPCTIECTAESGTGVTLSWYREGEKKPYSRSSVRSAPHLDLPQTVERSGTYTCEAKNSVSNETASITVGAHCTAVTVFGILGQSVKFPAAVEKGGFLMYSGVLIGDSSFMPPRNVKYRDRLQWDSSTGLFSLSGLKMEDIGDYKVQNTDQNIAVFQLNVYKDNVPVSKPRVSITQNEYPCTIECTAESGTGATLSWYREGEKKPYVTSPVQSAPHLHLPVPVDEGGIYTCEAKNSVSRETDPLTVGAHCTAPTSSSTGIIVGIIIAAVVVLIAVFFAVQYFRFERSRRAVRTLIQVKKLLDNVDPGAFGESMPPLSPDAVGSLIEVKKILDNVDPHEYAVGSLIEGFKIKRRAVKGRCNVKILPDNVDPHEYAVGSLIEVKKLLENMDPQAYDETMPALPPGDETFPPDDETFPSDAVGSLIKVKKILDNVDPHEYGFKRKCRGFQGRCKVKELFDNVDPGAYGDAVPAVPQSGPVDDLICFLQETKIVISSHQEP